MAQNRALATAHKKVPAQTEAPWRQWLETHFPHAVKAGFSARHQEFWDWVWAIEPGIRPRPFIALWPRGGGKSTSVELAVIAIGLRGKRRYCLYICDTQDRANEHLLTIANKLEAAGIQRRLNKYGSSQGWRRNRLCTHDFTIDALGLDVAARGKKLDDDRPDVICHKRDTMILSEGQIMKVQDHPTAQEKRCEGLEVAVHGLPESEIVTPEHRYWARTFESKRVWRPDLYREQSITLASEPGWVQAHELTSRHYIGHPISADSCEVQPIDYYVPGNVGSRNAKGQITSGGGAYIKKVPTEFSDPEWWWLFGLWWGDGHLGGCYQVIITIADTQKEIHQRVAKLLNRYGIKHSVQARIGCSYVIFSHAALNRWLRTWKSGNAMKQPPVWVESIAGELQAELMKGYIRADGWVSPKIKRCA